MNLLIMPANFNKFEEMTEHTAPGNETFATDKAKTM